MRTITILSIWLTLCVSQGGKTMADDSKPREGKTAPLSAYYGFGPLEILKLEWRSNSMVSGDFNHDGRRDLAIVDNSHSRIDLLLQRESKPDPAEIDTTSKDVNRIDQTWRFKHEKLPVNREIGAMTTGDFNHDGQADLAYFGNPDRLTVRYQSKDGNWEETWRTRLSDVEASTWSMAAGDYNHDGRDDLLILGEKVTYVLHQAAESGFAPPVTIRNTADNLRLAMTGDFDHNGRDDLFYLATVGDETVACVRLQTPQGTLGPEYRLDFKNPRGVTVFDSNGDGTTEIHGIDSQTGRVRMFQLVRPQPREDFVESRPIHYGIGSKGNGKRALDVGDVNGDGRIDVIVSEPETAQLIAYLQQSDGLDLGTSYPSFQGVEQLRLHDFTEDGRDEIVVFSPKEKTLGVCYMEGSRLTFPRSLPVDDGIVAFEIADLNMDSVPEIVYVTKVRQSRQTKFQLQAISYLANGETKPYIFGEDQTHRELDIRDVNRIVRVDANGDSRPDLLLTTDHGRSPLLLVTDERGVPNVVTGEGGVQLGNIKAGALTNGLLDEPALFVSQSNFTRRMRLDPSGRWQVLDQYNTTESGARISGAATYDVDGKQGNEIVLIDSGTNKLRIYRADQQLYRPWQEVDLGPFDYQSNHVADFNHDGKQDLLLFGNDRFAVLYTGQSDPTLKELASFESKRDKPFLADLCIVDVNGDGRMEIVAIDSQSHELEIIALLPSQQLEGVMAFKVFQEKSFQGSGGGRGMQPREMLIVDVTGDGRDDMILLTHDRLLVYPQDDGQSYPSADGTEEPPAN